MYGMKEWRVRGIGLWVHVGVGVLGCQEVGSHLRVVVVVLSVMGA